MASATRMITVAAAGAGSTAAALEARTDTSLLLEPRDIEPEDAERGTVLAGQVTTQGGMRVRLRWPLMNEAEAQQIWGLAGGMGLTTPRYAEVFVRARLTPAGYLWYRGIAMRPTGAPRGLDWEQVEMQLSSLRQVA